MNIFSAGLSIRNKIFLLFGLMITIIAITIFMILPQIKETIIDNSKKEMVTTTKLASVMTESLFDNSIRNYLRGVSESHRNTVEYYYKKYQDGSMSEEEALQHVEALLLSHRLGKTGYMVVEAIDNEKLTFAVHPKAKGMDVTKVGVAQQVAKKQDGYIEYEWKNKEDTSTRFKIVAISSFKEWQMVVGATLYKDELYSLMDKKEFRKSLHNANLSEEKSSIFTVFDINGEVIYHPTLHDSNLMMLQDEKTGRYFTKELIEKIKLSESDEISGWMEYSFSSHGIQEKIMRYIYLPKYQWIVASVINKDEVLRTYNTLKVKLAIAIVIMLVIIILLAVIAANYLNKRIGHLIQATQMLSNNEYDFTLIKRANDEIGSLETSFDNAREKIKVLIHKQEDLTANLEVKVQERTTELQKTKQEIEEAHKHIKDSIEYASLIQSALIPDHNKFQQYFKDYFAIWQPKDMVGGDIYLFEELRDDNECLLMVIDCTGHGVPGAFVTMLVKAIERQIVADIKHSDDVVSPAEILRIFNVSMKNLLKQEDVNSISNAGFDGQVVYFNKKEKIIKCASARNEIFYYQDDGLQIIKGDRHSIGYKDSDANYEFTEHTIDTSKETTLYIATDGFWDQNGGEKGLPYGKKRLKKMLENIHNESMEKQEAEFLAAFEAYRDGSDVNDDVTVIGIEI